MAPCLFFPWKPVAAVENPMASCKRRSQLSAASGVLLALANLAISKIRGEFLWYVCMAGRCCFLNRHCAAIINYFSFIMCCQQHGVVCANSVSKAGLLAMIKCSIYTLQTNQTDLLWRLKRLSLWLLLPKKNRCCSASRLWAQALVPNFVETWQIEDGEANLAPREGHHNENVDGLVNPLWSQGVQDAAMVDGRRPTTLSQVPGTPGSLPPVPAGEWDNGGDETPQPVQGLLGAMCSRGGIVRSQGPMPSSLQDKGVAKRSGWMKRCTISSTWMRTCHIKLLAQEFLKVISSALLVVKYIERKVSGQSSRPSWWWSPSRERFRGGSSWPSWWRRTSRERSRRWWSKRTTWWWNAFSTSRTSTARSWKSRQCWSRTKASFCWSSRWCFPWSTWWCSKRCACNSTPRAGPTSQ